MGIEELYPTLTLDELNEAEENLRRYFEIAFEISENKLKPANENRESEGIAPSTGH